MPISFVRCATLYAVTPYSPIAASTSATMPNNPARLATARCWSKDRSTCCCIVLTLVTVRFGSASARTRFSCGSSTPGGTSVTSISPRMKCDWTSVRFIIGFAYVDRLRKRDEEHRPRGLIEREPGELRVAHDADDAEGVDELRQVEAEALIERILIALEEPAHERLVHDRHRLRLLVVRGVK